MDDQSRTSTVGSAVPQQRRPWYVSDDSLAVRIDLPKEIVWARLSEVLRRTIVHGGSLFDPRVEYSGRVDGNDVEVKHKIGGRTGTSYAVTGELSRMPEGTLINVAIRENRFVRLGYVGMNFVMMLLVYGFLTGLRGSFLSASTLVSTLVFGVIVSIPMLISSGWHRRRALERTAELLTKIAEGRFYDSA